MKVIKTDADKINDTGDEQALKTLRLTEIDQAMSTARQLQQELQTIGKILPTALQASLSLDFAGLACAERLQRVFVGMDKDLPFLRHADFTRYWFDYGVEILQGQQTQISPLAKQLGHFFQLSQLYNAEDLAALALSLENESWFRYFYPSWRRAKQQLINLAATPMAFQQLKALLPALQAYRGYIDSFAATAAQYPCFHELELLEKGCFTDLSDLLKIREQYQHIAFTWCGDVAGFESNSFTDELIALTNMSYVDIEKFAQHYEIKLAPLMTKFDKQLTKLKLTYVDEFRSNDQLAYIDRLEALRNSLLGK